MAKVKFIATVIFTAACALLLAAIIAVLPNRLTFKGGESYTFYVGNTSKNCREVKAQAEAPVVRLFLKDVCGESATYKTLDIDSFLKSVNAEVLFLEELDDSVNYYCSASLPYSVTLYGKTVNLHVCVRAEGVTVASPIIFGGY